MKNRKILTSALLSIVLVFSLIFLASVTGASATIHLPDDSSISHSKMDSSSLASAMALNTSQGYVTPMVAAGAGGSIVGLKSDGTVIAVGNNWYGQCDIGGYWTDITQVDIGSDQTVGLKHDGTVLAVGANYDGRCNVGGWTDIVQVATGGHHTVGVKSDGTVVATGENGYEQCNVGDWADIIQVAAGGEHTVGLKSDGTVVAVGSNYHMVGNGTQIWDGRCEVGNWTDIIQVAAGGWGHTVGLKSDGTVVAVGRNDDGQCNVGDWTDIIQVAAYSHTVGLKSDGTVVAVGWNYYNECDVSSWTGIVQIAAGDATTVGLKADGTVVARGHKFRGECNVGSWTDIVQVAASLLGLYGHTVGLKADGTVVAVGDNNLGECDVGSWTDIVEVSVGGYYTVGLKSDGTVVVVGSTNIYYDVGSWTDIVQVAAGGGMHTVGLKSDGTVVATGENYNGQCNVGDWTDIIQVAAGYSYTVGLRSDGTVVDVGWGDWCDVESWTDIIQVTAGESHTVGLKSDGTVVVVLRYYNVEDSPGESDVGSWTDIVQVAAGNCHTVGLKSDGTVVAVGENGFGQCNVSGWTDIIQVAAGESYTVGLRSDGTVVAAGPEIELSKILLLIKASLHSPAEFRIYDSQGHVTGVIDGEVRDEIRWATFNQEDETVTALYGFDTYFYEVEGTGSGSYGLSMDVINEGQVTTFGVIDMPITLGAIHRYYVDWYALSEGEAGITIERDYDGDGEVDEVIITGIPMPTSPSPIDNATGVPLDQELSWVVGDSGAVNYDVYFGTETNPPLVLEEQTETTYAPTLNSDTTYYWRVTATAALNEYSIFSAGALWKFTTMVPPSLCFIATAAYDSPMAAEIEILRDFRDDYMLTNLLGQTFVDFYYTVSPPIAEFITEHPGLKPIARAGLVPAIAMSTVAVNTTPAEKAVTVGLLLLVSVAVAVWATRRLVEESEYTRR